jgi:hypothetical protein
MEDQPIWELKVLTQDGGNFGKLMDLSLETSRTIRLLPFQVELTTKTETLSLKTRMERLTNNGRSSMLMSMRRNQLRDNSTRSSVFMLREISTLFLNYQITDI